MSVFYQKAPFPWFGGKSKAAPLIWRALGDVDHYVEPFCGSLATLLLRPHECNRTYYSETVNDLDGFIVNFWRSVQLSPDATAEAASWPVSEADLHARHLRLLRWRSECDLERLMGDPEWHDPKMAGWWAWGQSSWIGGGWCSGKGSWVVGADGRIERRKGGRGVFRARPHISDNGQGVNRATLREPGVGEYEFHPMTMPELRHWFAFLAARLRHVRVLNGDWKRATTNGASKTLPVRAGGACGIFLDPPYSERAGRAEIYSEESFAVAHAVREWALGRGTDEDTRIVVAGFEGEHPELDAAGWRCVEWFSAGFLSGGMGGTGNQQRRERLWLSPHCLSLEPAPNPQMDFFDEQP